MSYPPPPGPAGPPPPYQPPWTPPTLTDEAAKKKKDTRNGCGCFLLIAVTVGIVIAITSSGSKSTPSSDTAAAPVAVAPADPITTDPEPAAPAPVAPTHNAAYTTAARLIAWDQGGGQDRLTAINTDFSQLAADANNNQDAVAGDCETISTDTNKAGSYKRIPDTAAQKHWAAALADFKRGAANCTQGVNSSDTAQLTKGADEISAGNTQVLAVAARFSAITDAMK